MRVETLAPRAQSRLMRVALVSFNFPEYCVRLASAISGRVDLALWLPELDVIPYLPVLSTRTRLRTFAKPRLRHAVDQTRLITALIQEIHDFQPDVIHLQAGHFWFNLALPVLRHYPLVVTAHDSRPHPGDAPSRKTPLCIVDIAIRRAVQVIVHAPQVKEELINRLRLRADAVHVIPHIQIGDDTEQTDVQEEEHSILFFGRIWKYKGLEYLIRAEPLITDEVPEARIIIAGAGENLQPYRSTMVHYERFIIHNEYASIERRTEFFRRASVVALPYVEASQSGVIPLAYLFGKPVVATAVGGLPAMVEDGRTGYLVPPRNERALANAIIVLLKNRDLRHQLGANGRAKLKTDCDPQVIGERTLTVYETAVSENHKHSR